MREPLRITLRLPPEPDSVSIARGVVRSMAARFAPVMMERAELALSELVTNAIRHGTSRSKTAVDVELTLVDDGVWGVVRDSGPPFGLPTSAPEPDRVGGFGLYIVQRVSDLHVDHTCGGNAVTFAVVDRSRVVVSG